MNKPFDYHNICSIDTPKKERRDNNIGDIYINAVICNKCNERIRSRNKHDFRSCGCGLIAVDGGSWYCRRSGGREDYEDISIPFNDIKEEK